MKKLIAICALAMLPSSYVLAQDPHVGLGAHISYVGNEAASGSDFDGSFRFEGFGQLIFNPHFAFEVGAAYSTATEDSGEDNQGTYTIEAASNDLFGGVRLDTQPFGPMTIYGRGGLLYYHTQLDFTEDFYGIKPGGSLEEVEEGIGYYLEGGAAFRLNRSLMLDAGITYRVRQDYFEDSSRPFDMKEIGAGVGLVYTPQ